MVLTELIMLIGHLKSSRFERFEGEGLTLETLTFKTLYGG